MTQQDQEQIVAELEGVFGAGYEGIASKPFTEQLPKCSIKAEVTNAYIGKSSNAGRTQLVAVCNIFECSAGEEFVGKTYTKTWGLVNEQNMEWLKRDLLALDLVPPKNPRDLIRVTNELIGVRFAGQLVPNKEDADQFPPNMFLNRGARLFDEGSTATAGKAAF